MTQFLGSISPADLLWKPLLEATAQTIVGAIGTYTLGRAVTRFMRRNSYAGVLDLWHRGIRGGLVTEGDEVRIRCQASSFTQLFPGDPFENAVRWNSLYQFPGKITSGEYQAMEFIAGSDAALRVGSLNGETLVGLFDRYGFIGDGLIGVAATTEVRRKIPEFLSPGFIGRHAVVTGTLSQCPGQHAYVAQAIAVRAGIPLRLDGYKTTWYLKIRSIDVLRGSSDDSATLLGTVWATTGAKRHQYITQYGYLTDAQERAACELAMRKERAWASVQVYCDDLTCPKGATSFRELFLG